MTIPIPGWFRRRPDSVAAELAVLRIEIRLVLLATERLIKMSETTDQALGELTALEQVNAAALAKLKADVAAFIAGIQNSGTLTAAQQAEVDALKAAMGADTATVGEIDTSVAPAVG